MKKKFTELIQELKFTELLLSEIRYHLDELMRNKEELQEQLKQHMINEQMDYYAGYGLQLKLSKKKPKLVIHDEEKAINFLRENNKKLAEKAVKTTEKLLISPVMEEYKASGKLPINDSSVLEINVPAKSDKSFSFKLLEE